MAADPIGPVAAEAAPNFAVAAEAGSPGEVDTVDSALVVDAGRNLEEGVLFA